MTILIADPRVAGIEIVDVGEPLVDLVSRGIACAPSLAQVDHGRWVRVGVADRLAAAGAALPAGVRILVVEGFRSAIAQQRTHQGYCRQLRLDFPGISEREVLRLASRYVAPLEVAPHVAGAAVDVLLIDIEGRALAMGTRVDATPEESDNACRFDAPSIGDEARSNRSMLAAALEGVGLVNYPTEWWHWSYGDRYWAHATRAEHALYGPVASWNGELDPRARLTATRAS